MPTTGPRFPGLLAPYSLSPDIPLLVQDPSDKTGQTLAINPDKGSQKIFWQRALANNLTFANTIAGGGQTVVNIIAPSEENLRGDYEVCALMSTSTGRFSAQIFHNTINRSFQNTAIPNNLLFGVSSFPSWLPETTYLPVTNGLQLTLTDLSGSPNTVSIVALGRRFLDWGNERIGDVRRRAFFSNRTHPYWLLDNRGPERSVAGTATDTLVLTVPNDADFNCVAILDDSDADYTMQIFEGLSSRALMDAQISAQSFVTATRQASLTVTGGDTFMRPTALGGGRALQWSHLFKRSSQINISITNLSGTTNKVRLALIGQLVYYNAPQTEQLTLPSTYAVGPQNQPMPYAGYGFNVPPMVPLGLNPGAQPGNTQPGVSGMGYIDARAFPGSVPMRRVGYGR